MKGMVPPDVQVARDRQRNRRLRRVLIVLTPPVIWLWVRLLSGHPVSPGWPHLPPEAVFWLCALGVVLVLGALLVLPMVGTGRSPEVIFLPEQIEVGFDDVVGLGPVLDEVRHTLDVFLNHRMFQDAMGGRPRRGLLFEGPPGTGKTHTAKALAKEAGVPFLFVSSTAFQSMWYGATARRIRAYFRRLRKVARLEGGAIGFIEELDAIGARRGASGTAAASTRRVERSLISEGTGGVVNELLVQMQSFDEPPRSTKAANALRRWANRYLPPGHQLKTSAAPFANILLIGATNRVGDLDPALLRPGRFDRVLHFPMPGRAQRRQLIDHFLSRKAHDDSMDGRARDDLAASTPGYSPAALERLFDEGLLFALRDGRDRLSAADLQRARLDLEIGLAEPAEYTARERQVLAAHEAGHALVAYLVGKGRKLDLLSIVKRRDTLGLLAHSGVEERYTRSRSESLALIQISLGGLAAEQLLFGESGSSAADDLAAATTLGAEMVGAMGLGGSLISLRAVDPGPLGGNLVARVLADAPARAALDRLLEESRQVVADLLLAYRPVLEVLRDALAERGELVGREIIEVIEAAIRARRPALDLRAPVG